MKGSASGKPRDPFSAALDALKMELKNGRLVLGEPLTITELAQSLGLSATPVREALSRLAGAGLIEDRRGRGYAAPRYEVSDLEELYGLRRLYLDEALRAGEMTDPPPGSETTVRRASAGDQLTDLLDWIAAQAGNRALFDAYRQVSDRLAPAVQVEGQVFALAEDLAGLRAVLTERVKCSTVLVDLHDARRRRAPDLIRAMRANANIASL